MGKKKTKKERVVLARLEGESREEYLARLRGMETGSWSVDDIMARELLIREVQRALTQPERREGEQVPDSLNSLKQQIRNLSLAERAELARWLALGMKN
jgi:hypothetical protein